MFLLTCSIDEVSVEGVRNKFTEKQNQDAPHAAQLMRRGISQKVSCTVGDFAIYVYMVHRKLWDRRSKSDSSNFLTMSNAVDHSRGSLLI